jgi:sulfite oxidase
VSLDGGQTFTTAELLDGGEAGSWRLWTADLDVGPGPGELVVRAWDSAASTQPESPAKIWNLKGYMNNAWHRARFTAGRDGGAPEA